MKKVIVMFMLCSFVTIACKRWGNKCGTCPDHSRKDYLKKERKVR